MNLKVFWASKLRIPNEKNPLNDSCKDQFRLGLPKQDWIQAQHAQTMNL